MHLYFLLVSSAVSLVCSSHLSPQGNAIFGYSMRKKLSLFFHFTICVLSVVCCRERPTDDASGAEFDSTIIHICKVMVSLGSTNLHCIFTDSSAIALYLKQVLIWIPISIEWSAYFKIFLSYFLCRCSGFLNTISSIFTMSHCSSGW